MQPPEPVLQSEGVMEAPASGAPADQLIEEVPEAVVVEKPMVELHPPEESYDPFAPEQRGAFKH